MARVAVVMFTPPRGNDVWFGRCDAAIDVVKRLGQDGVLLLAGDANGGRDLQAFKMRALEAGVDVDRIHLAFNGHDRAWKNTRGDARASAEVVEQLPRVERVVVVTCWYHATRAKIATRIWLAERMPERRFRVSSVRVWKVWPGFKAVVNDLRGAWDYWRGRPQRTRGEVVGKPDLAR